jgi:DNA-directed RNA polymerase specialized sigma24 family protein
MTDEEFAAAYSRAFRVTVKFLCHRGVSYDAAVDAAQDGWTRGWERREQLHDPDLLLPWVNSIALNIHRTYLRSKAATTVELPRWLPGSRLDTAPIDADSIMRMIPAPARRTLRQFYLEGNSVAELAAAWGCTITAARIRLCRARQLARSKTGKIPERS